MGASPKKHVVLMLILPGILPELQPAEYPWPLTKTVLANRHFAMINDFKDAQAAQCVAL